MDLQIIPAYHLYLYEIGTIADRYYEEYDNLPRGK